MPKGTRLRPAPRSFPLNLLDALRVTAKSELLRRELGDEFVDSYVKLKMREWNDYAGHLSAWERAATLDC